MVCFSFPGSPGLGLEALLSRCCLVSSWLEWWLPLVEVFGGASRSTASTGGFHLWRYSGVPLGQLLRPVVSPQFKCPGCRFTWSPGLFLLELLPPSCSGYGSSRCPSCSSHPSPAWFSSKTSASWVLTVASALDSARAFAFGRSLCSVSSSASSPSALVASWCDGWGASLPFFPCSFPLGS